MTDVYRTGDAVISRVPHAAAAGFIRAHHYAKGCANTSVYAFGIWLDGSIVGAATWMPPTRVAAESVSKRWREVLSLSRLVCDDSMPRNTESAFIGHMVRAIRKERKWTALVTYADNAQGHTGVIYRATNWLEIGQTKPERRWRNPETGALVSKKSAANSRTSEEMAALGYIDLGRTTKTKFVMYLGPQ